MATRLSCLLPALQTLGLFLRAAWPPESVPCFSFLHFSTPSKLLRVSLTGPESTGKSTLAAQLAAHYGTSFAPEFAREYLAESGPHYTARDLEEIARGQLAAEAEAAAQRPPAWCFATATCW